MEKLKILIVEDLDTDVELLLRQLKRDNVLFEYAHVSTRGDFEEALINYSPEVILSDHSLPRFNAWEALRIARQHDQHLPFILVTGTVSEEFAVDILRAGADDYILKASLKRLSSAVMNAVKRRQSEREREQVLAQLTKSQARLSAFTENSPTLQWIQDDKGEYIFANKTFRKIFGFKDEPGHISQGSLVSPFVAAGLSDTEKKVLSTGRAIEKVEKIPGTDNTDHYYLVSKFLMPGNHLGGIAVDITAQKLAEQKLTMLNEELNTFIYKASHDLKGPLSSIMGIANLTRNEQFEPKALKYIEMIAESTHKLDKILLGLIEVMSVKQSQVKLSVIDFTEVIDEVFKSLEYTQGFSRIKFNVQVSTHQPFISDRAVLVSVIQNMVENAVKYQDMARRGPFLDIVVTDHLGGVLLKFEDNGLGIDKEVIDRIFDMFFRGNEDSKGSGLGLYIVRNAVQKLGGTISVASEKGKGCRFLVYLPGMQFPKDPS